MLLVLLLAIEVCAIIRLLLSHIGSLCSKTSAIKSTIPAGPALPEITIYSVAKQGEKCSLNIIEGEWWIKMKLVRISS